MKKPGFITLSDFYLRVPFDEKEEVKEADGKWDKENKLWFAPPGLDPLDFRQFGVLGSCSY